MNGVTREDFLRTMQAFNVLNERLRTITSPQPILLAHYTSVEVIESILGRGLINAQPQPDRRELNEREVVGCELAVARCDPTTMLDLVEEPLDQIACSVKIRTEAQLLCPISFRWDIGPSAVLVNQGSDPVGVIAAVGEQHCSRLQAR